MPLALASRVDAILSNPHTPKHPPVHPLTACQSAALGPEARKRALTAASDAPPFPDELRGYQPQPLRIVGGAGNGKVWIGWTEWRVSRWVGLMGRSTLLPPPLINQHVSPLQTWYRVLSLPDLLGVLREEGNKQQQQSRVQVLVGNTAVQGVSKYYNGSFPANTPVESQAST